MPNTSSSSTSAMIISALGWVAAVLAVALALFVGKPSYYRAGYEQGRETQAAANIRAVDDLLSARTIEGENYVVLGRVTNKQSTAVEIETLNPYLVIPLRTGARRQVVMLTDETIMEKRTALSAEEQVQALEDGQRRGLTTDQIQQHRSEPLTIDDLRIGDEIRVYPVNVQDALKNTFTAKQILFVISSQTPQN